MYPHPSSERFLHRLHISTDDLFRFPHIRHLPLAILTYFASLFVLIPRHAPRCENGVEGCGFCSESVNLK